MRTLSLLFGMLLIIACSGPPKQAPKGDNLKKTVSADTQIRKIRYTDRQLETFLDSIGQLDVQTLADKVAFGIDSMFEHPRLIDRTLSFDDFNVLAKAMKVGRIGNSVAERIFGRLNIDTLCGEWRDSLMITVYPFKKRQNELDEYAIGLGDPDHVCNDHLYFFKNRKLLTEHTGWHRDGLDLENFKDSDGKTIVYFKECFDRGSGIWWYNWFFYKYDGDKLIPVLNELQSGNMQGMWGFRERLLDASILSTKPLTIKMVYDNYFVDTARVDNYGDPFINDSTIVKYQWNEQTKRLEGDYNSSKISKAQILTYYLNGNELLFINVNYKLLKTSLANKAMRPKVLKYLNDVKNYLNRKATSD